MSRASLRKHRNHWVMSAAFAALTAVAALPHPALAQSAAIAIEAQELGDALRALARATKAQILFNPDLVRGKRAPALSGSFTVEDALTRLLSDTGLSFETTAAGAYTIVTAPLEEATAASPAPAVAGSDDADEEVIVTARRMEERLIDVPVAVSSFSAKQLDERKIEGGAELLRGVPNVNFSKDNFTGYNFSIRGIGAKVLATTADPGVAISFNNTPLLRNRLFEQEYFDVQRVEVLRGPQGTLYGRNATAGVVNMLPNIAELGEFYGDLQLEAGNHESRRARGHINIPIGDKLAFRLAGAMTQRDGYDYNTVTEKNVNGRDLWSIRAGLNWEVSDDFRVNVMWERFREDDDRGRTGKMLCTRGETPASIDWTDYLGVDQSHALQSYWTRTTITPACSAGSLYDDAAFGVPDGRGFPMTAALINMNPFGNNPRKPGDSDYDNALNNTNVKNGYDGFYLFPLYLDPFAVEGNRQVADLRTVSTAYDPKFKAKNDLFQLNMEWDVAPGLTLSSQTLYMKDSYSGMQDFFRTYATGQMYAKEQIGLHNGQPRAVKPGWAPWLGDSVADGPPVYGVPDGTRGAIQCGPLPDCGFPTGGVWLDPQLGATDRFMALDLSEAESTQWSQEFRLQSDWDGPFNFNFGVNWLKYRTEENYYIFSNIFTMMAVEQNMNVMPSGNFDRFCNLTAQGQAAATAGTLDPNICAYIDPNPLGEIDGDGHNYIRSISISETESWAIFGEGYYDIADNLSLTLGLRYTDDTKAITPVPSQLLADTDFNSTGLVGRGYPRYPDEKMSWREFTGRVAIDWKPDLSFTDETLVYASFSRGYKGGGGNARDRDYNPNLISTPELPSRYNPEFVNAFEIGTKNMLAGGRLMLNATGFFYDYKDYQVAQLMERAIHNENFDAKIWGAEFEAAWAPDRNFRVDATVGILRTRIGDGEKSIDIMNRTQGNEGWTVMKPWPGSPSTCIVPNDVVGRIARLVDARGNTQNGNVIGNIMLRSICPSRYYDANWVPGSGSSFNYATNWRDIWQAGDPLSYNPLTDAPNGGRGFDADLSGNELPNAPKLTFNIGVQYRVELPGDWDMTLRGDYYRQSDSWMRVYNLQPYDRLKGWDNTNVSVTFTSPDRNFVVQAYVKNLFDKAPITDGFTGPDELGNITNVFTLDPRIIGVSGRYSF